MSKMLVFFWCALALGIVTGAFAHIKQSTKKDISPLFLPTKCQEVAHEPQSQKGCNDSMAKDSRTSELFLRKVTRTPRRFYA